MIEPVYFDFIIENNDGLVDLNNQIENMSSYLNGYFKVKK